MGVAGLLAIAAMGCGGSMGMDRGPLDPVASDQPREVDDPRIAAALAHRPQLAARSRVGVYFVDPPPSPGESRPAWRWTFEERQQVVEAAAEVDDIELFPLSDSLVSGTDPVSLRLAAAEHGADAILVVEGQVDQETHDNAWLATYPLLLPILFAPAQELDTRFVANARMLDVRNGFLYLTAEAEGLEEQQRAHLWIDRDGGIRVAKQDAIAHLGAELGERLAHLIGPSVPDAASSESVVELGEATREDPGDDAEASGTGPDDEAPSP
jgi:hypothetical protein